MIVTADHGFIYQNQDLPESDFAESNYKGKLIKHNRRFVLESLVAIDPEFHHPVLKKSIKQLHQELE